MISSTILSKNYRFLDNYGTHYVVQADMGALFGEQSMISAKNYNEMVGNGIDINAYAGKDTKIISWL